MTNMLQLSEDEFDVQYPLVAKHIDPHATWAFDDGPGCLFGLSHDELAFVTAQNPANIWTLIDGDEFMWLLSGYHHVNRVGYLISTKSVLPDMQIEVQLETPSSQTITE